MTAPTLGNESLRYREMEMRYLREAAGGVRWCIFRART